MACFRIYLIWKWSSQFVAYISLTFEWSTVWHEPKSYNVKTLYDKALWKETWYDSCIMNRVYSNLSTTYPFSMYSKINNILHHTVKCKPMNEDLKATTYWWTMRRFFIRIKNVIYWKHWRKVGAIEALTPPFGELISTENDITNRVLRKSFVW